MPEDSNEKPQRSPIGEVPRAVEPGELKVRREGDRLVLGIEVDGEFLGVEVSA